MRLLQLDFSLSKLRQRRVGDGFVFIRVEASVCRRANCGKVFFRSSTVIMINDDKPINRRTTTRRETFPLQGINFRCHSMAGNIKFYFRFGFVRLMISLSLFMRIVNEILIKLLRKVLHPRRLTSMTRKMKSKVVRGCHRNKASPIMSGREFPLHKAPRRLQNISIAPQTTELCGSQITKDFAF